MGYLPQHAAPTTDEWDGTDPLTALEEQLDRQYSRQDAKRTTQASTGRINRKDLRDTLPRQRRIMRASRPHPGKVVWEF